MNRSRQLIAFAVTALFFAIAAVFATSAWLRPPLSPDFTALQLPIGLWHSSTPPEELLQRARPVPFDSIGAALLIVIALGLIVTLRDQRRMAWAAGALLAISIAANAAAALNHPVLIERLSSEHAQRQAIVDVLRYTPSSDPLSTASNGRVAGPTGTPIDPLWADLLRPFDFLVYGRWLIAWSALGVWFGTRGGMRRRLRFAGAFVVAGVLLAAIVCSHRLYAESRWIAARQLETRGDLEAADDAIQAAIGIAPEFARLQRTWLLTGKLDYLRGRATPAESMFRAAQLSAAPPDVSAEEATAHPIEHLTHAASLLRETCELEDEAGAMARMAAAQILTRAGIEFYAQPPRYTDGGLDYATQKQQLAAAADAWQRAAQLDPLRLDAPILRTVVAPLIDRGRPELVPADVTIADRLLEADILNLLGDAYFQAGLLTEARFHYARSLDLLNLPQRKNFRAQKGLGGL